MTDPNAPTGALAAEAIHLLIDAVEQIQPEAWDEPSNLEGWSLRDVVGHATGSAAKIVTLVEGGEIWGGPSQPTDWICEDPAGRLRDFLARLAAALPRTNWDAMRPAPEGEAPLRRALIFPVSDIALHSWDIHRSQGRLIELPEDLLALCRGLVESLPESVTRRPGAFGPAKPAPAEATPTARLMAHLGRAVDSS